MAELIRKSTIRLDGLETEYAGHIQNVMGYRHGLSDVNFSDTENGTRISVGSARSLLNAAAEIIQMDSNLAENIQKRIGRERPQESTIDRLREEIAFHGGRAALGDFYKSSLEEEIAKSERKLTGLGVTVLAVARSAAAFINNRTAS